MSKEEMVNSSEMIEVECISDDDIIEGRLTKGKKYLCVAWSNIGDLKLFKDDNNGEKGDKWYKREFFKFDWTDLKKIPYVKMSI